MGLDESRNNWALIKVFLSEFSFAKEIGMILFEVGLGTLKL